MITRPAGLRSLLSAAGQSVAAAVLATVLVGLAVWALGKNPVLVIGTLAQGALGDWHRFADSLTQACPLILCGLAVAVAFRCQAWNIGVEGQYLAGCIVATALGVKLAGWPGWLLIPTMLAGAAAAGALFALPAVLLDLRRQVPLVLSTILLNFVAGSLVAYLTQGPLQGADRTAPESELIAPQAYLRAIVPQTDLHGGILLALTAAVAIWVMLRWHTSGFRLRVAGLNPTAARWIGINVDAVKCRAMCLSGALGGLAGGLQIAGVHHLLRIDAAEGFGYVAIAVALLGWLHPLGVVAAAVAIGMLDMGAFQLQRHSELGVSADLAEVLKGAVILVILVLSGTRVTRWMRTITSRGTSR